MPMCPASSPMESPSSPCVVARLAAACRMAHRLWTPSARGFRPARRSPSDRPDSEWSLFILDIIARPVVLCQRTNDRAFYWQMSETERTRFMSPTDNATPSLVPDFAAVKRRQQNTWASGDFSVVASRIVFQAEHLCEAAGL